MAGSSPQNGVGTQQTQEPDDLTQPLTQGPMTQQMTQEDTQTQSQVCEMKIY